MKDLRFVNTIYAGTTVTIESQTTPLTIAIDDDRGEIFADPERAAKFCPVCCCRHDKEVEK